jgi:TRAP-type C4-dicarboxylate transport system permease small subunit
VLLVVAWSSFGIVRLLYEYGQTTDALEFPMWIPQSLVTIALVIIALLMFVRLVLSKARA